VTWILALLGLATGVLINLCADSLPVVRRMRRPTCPYCGRPRSPIAWSAVSAYLFRRQHCAGCGAPISLRHASVEVGVALFFGLSWLRTGATVTTLLNLIYGSILVLILVTDIEHRLILHVVTLPAILIALAGAFVNPVFDSPKRALLGGGIGLLSTFTLYLLGALFARAMGAWRGQAIDEVAFGFGDVTLTTFIGLIVGAPEIIFAILIGFLSGGLVAILILAVRGLLQKRYQMFTAIPYGPFLILGGVTMLYWGQEFMNWYLG
jgi:prepilin signal peptidase PulO-like enzyme (type II secretory pathway)